MKKNKNLIRTITTFLFVFSLLSAFSQVLNQVSLRGNISNNTFTTATLYQIGQEPNQVGKTTVSPNGEFSFTQNIQAADFYKLEFDKENFIMMILKPGEVVEITTDAGQFLKQLQIKGSEETKQIFANQRIIDEAKYILDSISNLSYKCLADPKHDSLMKVYADAYEKIEMARSKALGGFMLSHTTSLANLFLPEAFPIDANIETYLKLDTALYAKYPNNFYVNNLHMQIVSAKKTRIGSPAPDFTLPDTNGVNFSLSSLKGKYVLIDFWAAWCNPCMKEMPNVIKLYNDFHGKGLEIVGVSLDKTRNAWLGAIKAKNLSWIQVSDVKFWQSAVVPIYNVSAIPYTVLIDKEGRIVAKNLRGEELYKKVESLLK